MTPQKLIRIIERGSREPLTAFLTGSRAYGTPREDSDVDLAVLVSPETASILWKLGARDGGSVKFGPLNLITFSNEQNFLEWSRVNAELCKKGPVTREEAMAAFQAAGFTGDYGAPCAAKALGMEGEG